MDFYRRISTPSKRTCDYDESKCRRSSPNSPTANSSSTSLLSPGTGKRSTRIRVSTTARHSPWRARCASRTRSYRRSIRERSKNVITLEFVAVRAHCLVYADPYRRIPTLVGKEKHRSIFRVSPCARMRSLAQSVLTQFYAHPLRARRRCLRRSFNAECLRRGQIHR